MDWDRIVRNYLSEYYDEGDLKRLCLRVGIKWDDLGGIAVAPKDKIDGLLKKTNLLLTYHKLLCEMTEEREPVFREAELFIHLYDEGIKLVEKWRQSIWQPPEQRKFDPEKCSKGAHQVFLTLRKIQEAYLQIHLSEYLRTTASDLQAQGEWPKAAHLLEEFYSDLPNSDEILFMLRSIREVLSLCGEIREAIEGNNWGKAKTIYDNLVKTYPSCSSYPEVGEFHKGFKRLEDLLKRAITALSLPNWAEAEALEKDLRPKYETYPGVQDFINKLEWPRKRLAEAQQLIGAKDWKGVKEALDKLWPEYETYPGVSKAKERIDQGEVLYQRALDEMVNQRWAAATKTLIELEDGLPGFLDAAKMLRAIRQGLDLVEKAKRQRQDLEWLAAQKSLEQAIKCLPQQHVEAQQFLDQLKRFAELYKQGSEFFAEAKYEDALVKYRDLAKSAPDYEDCRDKINMLERWEKLFIEAVRHVTDKEWDQAESILQELNRQCPSGYRNAPELLADVQHVIAIQAALQSSLVEDDYFVWEQGSSPYAILQASGIPVNPAISMLQMDTLNSSQAKRTFTPETQSAWDQLCSIEQRLFVDAYLYRAPQADAMLSYIETTIAQNRQFPSDDKLASEFPEAVSLILLLMGQREQAIEKWRARQREQPRAGAPAHALALCCLSNACQAEKMQKYTIAINEWRRALAQFVLALNDRNYWREWGRERGETYERAVLPNLIEELRQKIEADLSERLFQRAERFTDERQNELAAQYQQLALDLRIEMDATHLLKTQGGLPLETGRKVWFGPLLLNWEPDLGRALAQYCADLFNQPKDVVTSLLEGKPTESTARRLRLYFSSLRYASAWLSAVSPNPENALEQLLHADCGECPKKACGDATCTFHHASTAPVRLCCPTCPNFNQHNPGYAQLPEPGKALRLDAFYLATYAYLKLAAVRVAWDEESDSLESILTSWQEALKLAEGCGWEVDVREEICETALASAAKQVGRSWAQYEDTHRLDRAVALLDYLYQQETFQDRTVTVKLVEYLTDRGVYQINHDEHRKALEDLERAYSLTHPITDQARDNYAAALILVAGDAIANDRDEAQHLLDRADQLLQEGKDLHPEYAEYTSTQQLLELVRQQLDGQSDLAPEGDALQDLKKLLGSVDTEKDTAALLIAQAIAFREEDKLTDALDVMENAWQRAPQRNDVLEELLITLAKRMEQLESKNDSEQSTQLYTTWRGRLADYPRETQYLNFARWSPRIIRALEQTDFVVHSSMQEFMLPFEADNLGTIMVRLTVEGELLRVAAFLPFPSLEDETVLSNLLIVTGDIMFFRACSFETGSLALATYVPLTALSSEQLELLIRTLACYVDIAPTVPGQIGALRDHMRHAREVTQQKAQEARLPFADLDTVQKMVQERGWHWELASNHVAAFGPSGTGNKGAKLTSLWKAEANQDGFKFSTDLGYLRVGGDPLDLYQRLLRLNGASGLGKLTLTAEARLQLAVELPLLDQAAFEVVIQVLATNAEPLRRELTQS